MSKTWIPVRGAQGRHSRQAHADMPEGTYEREISKEGFFGPAAFLHHRRPPTGWVKFEGPPRPRAFDLARLNETAASPWSAPVLLHNAATDEYAVMIDTRDPLEVGDAASMVENTAYVDSWKAAD